MDSIIQEYHRSLSPLSPDEVRAFRKIKGWTQKEAARALGVSPLTWIRWERRLDSKKRTNPPLYLRLAFTAVELQFPPWFNKS